jgi:hypothetical protein
VPGYCAKVPFAVGVKQTVDYVLSHAECQREDPEFDEWCDTMIAKIEVISL